MTLKELKTGLLALLMGKYPRGQYHYYSQAVVEGYKRPAIFTQLKPTLMEPVNYNTRKNMVSFYITLMPKKVDEAEALDMIEEIRNLFGLSVTVGGRAVDVTGFDFDFIGSDRNIPEISIDLEWYDRIEHVHKEPPMEALEINKKLVKEE